MTTDKPTTTASERQKDAQAEYIESDIQHWIRDEVARKAASAPETRTPMIDGARQPDWRKIQREAGNAPKRTIPAEKPTAIKTEMSINECSLNVVKTMENTQEAYDEAIRLLNQSEAHADKLAEALRETVAALGTYIDNPVRLQALRDNAKQALAAYEAAQ